MIRVNCSLQYIERTNQFSNDEVNAQSEELVKPSWRIESSSREHPKTYTLLEHTGCQLTVHWQKPEETIASLNVKQLTNLTQLGALSDRIENIDRAANRHMEHTQLDESGRAFQRCPWNCVEHVNDENGASNAKLMWS